jgi:hypothetical protein
MPANGPANALELPVVEHKYLGEKVKRRILILVALAAVALVCVNIAPAHLVWGTNAAVTVAPAHATAAAPSAKSDANILNLVGVNLSEPVALLLLGTLLLSFARVRRRFYNSQNGATFQK